MCTAIFVILGKVSPGENYAFIFSNSLRMVRETLIENIIDQDTSKCLFPMVSDEIFTRNFDQSKSFARLYLKNQGSTDDSQEDVDSDRLFPMDRDEDSSGGDRSVSKYSPICITSDTF